MTVEEIKQTTSMRDVLAKYGVNVNRNNMCCCPIHGEKHPSMKVFPDGFKCFACGANGDIFSFVQQMEGCSFKEAFMMLGGTYKDDNKIHKQLMNAKFAREKQKREREKASETELKKVLSKSISDCRRAISENAAFSDKWCIATKYLPCLEDAWESLYITGEEVNELDVYRTCQRIKGL